jgi:hypothetical protein
MGIKIRKTHKEVSQKIRQENEVEFIHRQFKKRRRKNPDQNAVASKEDKPHLHP